MQAGRKSRPVGCMQAEDAYDRAAVERKHRVQDALARRQAARVVLDQEVLEGQRDFGQDDGREDGKPPSAPREPGEPAEEHAIQDAAHRVNAQLRRGARLLGERGPQLVVVQRIEAAEQALRDEQQQRDGERIHESLFNFCHFS